MGGRLLGIAIVLAALVCVTGGGIAAYRRALPGGRYEGTTRGTIARGAILGVFLGIAGFLATLLIVLVILAVR